jgi:phosphomannomutase
VNEWLTQRLTQRHRAVKELAGSLRTEESFYKDLEFGTGGMRSVMGVGNQINKYPRKK